MSSSSFLSMLQSLFTWIWQSSLAGAIVILFIGLFQMAFRKWLPARLAYLLWSCALLRLLLPITPSSHFSLFNLLPWADSSFSWRAAASQTDLSPVLIRQQPVASPTAPGDLAPLMEPNRMAPSLSPTVELSLFRPLPFLCMFGTLTYLTIIIARHRRLSTFLVHQKPIAHHQLQDCIDEGMRLFHLRQKIHAFEVRPEQPPAIFGLFRPKLLISTSVLNQLSNHELRLLVLHELAHVARQDVLVNWLTIILQAFHWFNPFVWLALKHWRTAREAVCDAQVLSLLADGERHSYGTMLLKMASHSPEISTSGVVPIFRTKKEIHRRITMIAQFKPTTRLAVLGSATILVIVAVATLTGAVQKPAPIAPPTTAAAPTRNSEDRLRGLRKALEESEQTVKLRQSELNELKTTFRIIDDDGKQQSENGSALLRKIEALRMDANADYFQLSSLVKQLSTLSRTELRKALPVVSPDPQLTTLQQDYAATQQKLVDLSAQNSSDHPDVKRAKALIATIDGQVNERLDGIMAGLKARLAIAEGKLQDLNTELERASKSALEKSKASRPYFNAKRDLETQIAFHNRLQARLQEEEINALLQDK